MATFAKATFNSVQYASFRPTYPRQLFDFVFRYHERGSKARWDTAIDLGCGTAQATHELTPFRHIIGVDPSSKMLDEARRITRNSFTAPGDAERFEFIQSPAEELAFIEDASTDLVVAAQAAHWFDWQKLWPEIARILRPDGSAAFWGYSEFRLTGLPSLTPLISAYTQGSDPTTSLGPHWQQPGRSIVDNHLLDIPKAADVVPNAFKAWEHVFFSGDHYPQLPEPQPVILRQKTTWDGLLSYLRTFSSLHTFHERFPDDLERADGDIAVRFINQLKAASAKEGMEGDEVTVEWPLAVILVKRA